MELDKVIVSSDINPQFLNFWPIVAKSWKMHFGINPTLAIVSPKKISKKKMETLQEFGPVYVEISSSKAPIANQAKMLRWYLATKSKSEIVSIEDIDTIYLTNDYLNNRLKQYRHGMLLGIGDDVNQEDPDYRGKFPASNLTGSGFDFQRFFKSPDDETFEDFLLKFKDLKKFDLRESPFNRPTRFSDESLIRALRSSHANELIHTIPRAVDIRTEWMDRSWWPQDNQIPPGAILANMPRPLFNNQEKCQQLLSIYFPGGYPWIDARKSRFWENPDSTLRQKIGLYLQYFLKQTGKRFK